MLLNSLHATGNAEKHCCSSSKGHLSPQIMHQSMKNTFLRQINVMIPSQLIRIDTLAREISIHSLIHLVPLTTTPHKGDIMHLWEILHLQLRVLPCDNFDEVPHKLHTKHILVYKWNSISVPQYKDVYIPCSTCCGDFFHELLAQIRLPGHQTADEALV